MKRVFVASLAAASLLMGTGCATVYRFIGDMTAKAITQKTADLRQVSASVGYSTHLYPKSTGVMSTEYEAWTEGGGMISVVLFKRQGVGMYELDGGVGVKREPDGPLVPMTYVGSGAYMASVPKGDTAPRTVVLRSSNGQTASYRLTAVQPAKIRGINGKASGATIDLSKDLVLDLDGAQSGQVKISLITGVMGLKTMADIGVFRAAKRLVIPAAAFRNMLVSASVQGVVGIQQGENMLVVERFFSAAEHDGQVGAVLKLTQALDWAPVTVIGEAPTNTGLAGEGEVAFKAGKVQYTWGKPNAYYGRSLMPGQQIALGALRARGTLYQRTRDTSTSHGPGTTIITTTTTTLRFPEVPDAHWDHVLRRLEAGLGQSLQRATGNGLLPVSRVAGSATYRKMEVMAEKKDTRESGTTTAYVERVLPGSRFVFPESFAGMLGAVSSTFAADRPISRVLSESHLDGLLSATLDLQIATRAGSEALVLVPRLSYVIYGAPNGYSAGPTSYGGGTVQAFDGVPFDEAELRRSPQALERVVRMPELLAAFEKSLKDLRGQERQAGYDAIWKLQ